MSGGSCRLGQSHMCGRVGAGIFGSGYVSYSDNRFIGAIGPAGKGRGERKEKKNSCDQSCGLAFQHILFLGCGGSFFI